eukprot:998726-Pyramimonas_sp.AAC.1
MFFDLTNFAERPTWNLSFRAKARSYTHTIYPLKDTCPFTQYRSVKQRYPETSTWRLWGELRRAPYVAVRKVQQSVQLKEASQTHSHERELCIESFPEARQIGSFSGVGKAASLTLKGLQGRIVVIDTVGVQIVGRKTAA